MPNQNDIRTDLDESTDQAERALLAQAHRYRGNKNPISSLRHSLSSSYTRKAAIAAGLSCFLGPFSAIFAIIFGHLALREPTGRGNWIAKISLGVGYLFFISGLSLGIGYLSKVLPLIFGAH